LAALDYGVESRDVDSKRRKPLIKIGFKHPAAIRAASHAGAFVSANRPALMADANLGMSERDGTMVAKRSVVAAPNAN
jgi:hypothetical protein